MMMGSPAALAGLKGRSPRPHTHQPRCPIARARGNGIDEKGGCV